MAEFVLGIISSVAGMAKDWADSKLQTNNQDTGRALQRGDDAQGLAKEAQDIHDARSDPAVVDRMREQSHGS